MPAEINVCKAENNHFLLFLRMLLNLTHNICILVMEVREYQHRDLEIVSPHDLVDKYASIKVHGFAFQSTVTLILP